MNTLIISIIAITELTWLYLIYFEIKKIRLNIENRPIDSVEINNLIIKKTTGANSNG